MRVTNVEQQNKTWGVLKAGAFGAGAAAVASRFAPLTTEEHAAYFTESVISSIDNAARNAKMDEVLRIKKEFSQGALNVSQSAFDTFERHTNQVVNGPKKDVAQIIKDADDKIKSGVKSLFTRVEKAGSTVASIQKNTIKNAAKSSRNIGYFAIMGAFIAMTGKVLYNTIVKSLEEPETKSQKPINKPTEELTMADILLEGLGTNTEILLLTSEAISNKK